jgi:hypothetical protein
MPTCPVCGAETIVAVAPGGRRVALDFAHVWVRQDQPWPTCLFTIGAAPAGGGQLSPWAIPALEFLDRPHRGPAGPFRREHSCDGSSTSPPSSLAAPAGR